MTKIYKYNKLIKNQQLIPNNIKIKLTTLEHKNKDFSIKLVKYKTKLKYILINKKKDYFKLTNYKNKISKILLKIKNHVSKPKLINL